MGHSDMQDAEIFSIPTHSCTRYDVKGWRQRTGFPFGPGRSDKWRYSNRSTKLNFSSSGPSKHFLSLRSRTMINIFFTYALRKRGNMTHVCIPVYSKTTRSMSYTHIVLNPHRQDSNTRTLYVVLLYVLGPQSEHRVTALSHVNRRAIIASLVNLGTNANCWRFRKIVLTCFFALPFSSNGAIVSQRTTDLRKSKVFWYENPILASYRSRDLRTVSHIGVYSVDRGMDIFWFVRISVDCFDKMSASWSDRIYFIILRFLHSFNIFT